jgi:hypothetical protein
MQLCGNNCEMQLCGNSWHSVLSIKIKRTTTEIALSDDKRLWASETQVDYMKTAQGFF